MIIGTPVLAGQARLPPDAGSGENKIRCEFMTCGLRGVTRSQPRPATTTTRRSRLGCGF
jgi:hypothetical protein